MIRRAAAIAGIILMACVGFTSCNLSREGYIVKITQAQLQERLGKKFPITKRYLAVLNLTLADPEVVLREGSDRIGFGLSALTNVSINDKGLAGRAHVTARVRYNRDEGSLLLVDPEVESLTITPLPDKYRAEVTEAANLAVKEFLDSYEVYRLDQADFKQSLARFVLKDVAVRDGVLRVTLGLGE